jgi:hypothetical protein
MMHLDRSKTMVGAADAIVPCPHLTAGGPSETLLGLAKTAWFFHDKRAQQFSKTPWATGTKCRDAQRGSESCDRGRCES